MSERDDEVERFLAWRGVETPCRGCGGAGTRAYGSTATWRGGVGGQSMTSDVCDRCWGTGDAERHGANLRELSERMKSARRDGARAMQERCADLLHGLREWARERRGGIVLERYAQAIRALKPEDV